MSDVKEERSYLVVKSNELIQKTKYDLSVQEQKILCYIISKIKPTDTELKRIEFDLRDFCAVCGISFQHKNYENIKSSMKDMRDKSFWIESAQKSYLLSWIEEVEIDKEQTKGSIKIDSRLLPYLIGLSSNFTRYELHYILLMRSKYSIRLYEILKSYADYDREIYSSVEDLRAKLAIDKNKYIKFADFRKFVLENSIEEINKYTDIDISYSLQKDGVRIADIVFTVKKKDTINRLIVGMRDDEILNKERERI